MDERLRTAGGGSALFGLSVTLLASALVSVVWGAVPFPPIAVAERVANATPGGIATLFIEVLQHLALPLTVAAVVLGITITVWLVGRWALPPVAAWAGSVPAALLLVLPLWAIAVASFEPDSTTVSLGVYAAMIGVAAGAGGVVTGVTYRRLLREDGTDPAGTGDRARREVLRALGLGAASLAIGWLRIGRLLLPEERRARPLGVKPAEPATAAAPAAAFDAVPGLAPLITPTEDFYVVDEEIIDPDVDPASWRLRIHGDVDAPFELTYDDLLAMPLAEQHATMACISNPVGGDLISTATWAGVRLPDLLGRAGVRDGALEVVFRAIGGYSDSLPLEDALREITLIAVGMNGEALPRAHGFPARLLAPGYYGMKQPKWLESIEVVSQPYEGYWERRGWIKAAVVKTWSRADVVDETDRGAWVVAGVAFAGDRGIERVEVSIDGGRGWIEAELEGAASELTWRRWKVPFEPGDVTTILVRATDGDGLVQTDMVAQPHPSGATGYDAVRL